MTRDDRSIAKGNYFSEDGLWKRLDLDGPHPIAAAEDGTHHREASEQKLLVVFGFSTGNNRGLLLPLTMPGHRPRPSNNTSPRAKVSSGGRAMQALAGAGPSARRPASTATGW